MQILVVGAGFAGAVHARLLAEAGHHVTVIDRRPHIAGNAFDETDANGIRVHRYGPHIFHSRLPAVLDWIRRFAAFVPYTHRVRARLPGGAHVPLPINLDTVNAVFGTDHDTAEQVQAHLASLARPIATANAAANAAEYLHSRIGETLTDLFFRPYTRKMWALDLEDIDPAIVRRIPLRTDRTDTYFAPAETQLMPVQGYTALFQSMLDHPRISLALATAFHPSIARGHGFCFNSMAIDEYYAYRFGPLPYRSLRFHARTEPAAPPRGWAVTNFTDAGPLTRETAWHEFPGHVVRATGRHTITAEEPCADHENAMERYYPVRTADGRHQKSHDRYRELAAAEPAMRFIGRCGTYRYLDMDQVINQSLASARAWLAAHP